ncbi:MAG: 3-deoxy-manno-octulosonate cytidylyltransferase (CMP-KDO synthetase) [Gammaproteobacteria bacterium]|jgi:3-deoxy-manno-octulosonate cytidylyltransferase (CMP-KDO synthetase)
MSTAFRVVIPARYASTRLPGKPLRKIHEKSMIEWVYQAANNSEAKEVIVATDDDRISKCVERFGGNVCMTRPDHKTGTDRILEVVEKNNWTDEEIVVNLQGDEPLMPSSNLTQVADLLQRGDCDMATLHKPVDQEDARDTNLVKLVHDKNGRVLYFSRSVIPLNREGGRMQHFGHIGLYAYRVGFIKAFSQLDSCDLELTEQLEQLRALWHGHSIDTELAGEFPGPGVDTEKDLLEMEKLMSRL